MQRVKFSVALNPHPISQNSAIICTCFKWFASLQFYIFIIALLWSIKWLLPIATWAWCKKHMSETHSRRFIICYVNSTFTFREFYKVSIRISFTVLKFIINLALFFSFTAFSEVFFISLHLQKSIIRLTTTLVLYIYFHKISFFIFWKNFAFLSSTWFLVATFFC